MNNLSSDKLLKAFSEGFHRFNMIIFIVLVAVALGVVALSLLGITQKALDNNTTVSSASANFDTATIKRLNELRPAADFTPPEPPPTGQRSNPFSE